MTVDEDVTILGTNAGIAGTGTRVGEAVLHAFGGRDAQWPHYSRRQRLLFGRGGNDMLDGGTGADAMTGGAGNDTFVVDNVGDTVTELLGEGIDEIRTNLATYWLAALVNAENLTGTNASGQTLTGNGSANLIRRARATSSSSLRPGALQRAGNQLLAAAPSGTSSSPERLATT